MWNIKADKVILTSISFKAWKKKKSLWLANLDRKMCSGTDRIKEAIVIAWEFMGLLRFSTNTSQFFEINEGLLRPQKSLH